MPVIIVEGPPKDKKKREKLIKALSEALKEVYGYSENSTQIAVHQRDNILEITNTINEHLTEKRKI